MTRLSGELQTHLPTYEAIVACTEAIDGLGWHIEDVEANRIVARADTGSRQPPKIEVMLRESGQGTTVRIIGDDTDAEPLPRNALIAELERARDAIDASLGGATGAPPVRGRPHVGRRRMAIAGIIAGLLAIGLGIVGIAMVNDGSEDTKRDLKGKESTVNSEAKQGKEATSEAKQGKEATSEAKQGKEATSEAKQGKGPAASSRPGLGDTQEIRDGDEHFALTPTSVGREGSYITLDIKIAGLGNGGFDTTGRGLLGTLVGSNGQPYQVESSGGPGGCEPPMVRLSKGQTRNGCLPFKVPRGVEADIFQYRSFFIGGDRVEWELN
jgi:hypothetical protein